MILAEVGSPIEDYQVVVNTVLNNALQTQFGSRAHGNAPNNSKHWTIGARYWNGWTQCWKGKLGIFRVYNEYLDETNLALPVSDSVVKLDATIAFQEQKLINNILSAAPRTVEAWVKTSIGNDLTGTIYYQGVNVNTQEFVVQCKTGKLAFTYGLSLIHI